jgi:hypothetical protein
MEILSVRARAPAPRPQRMYGRPEAAAARFIRDSLNEID